MVADTALKRSDHKDVATRSIRHDGTDKVTGNAISGTSLNRIEAEFEPVPAMTQMQYALAQGDPVMCDSMTVSSHWEEARSGTNGRVLN